MPIQIKKEPQYHIECKLDDIDMSSELVHLSINRSSISPYSLYVLKFKTDTDKRKFFDNINPQMDIKLNIQLFLEGPHPTYIWETTLTYITDEVELPYKYNTYNQESDKQIVYSELTILAIPKRSLQSSIQPLQNQILFNQNIFSILDTIKTDEIDLINPIENNTVIDQYIVEKQSFIKELEKLNFYYGLYKGPMFRFHNEYTNNWKIGSINKSFIKQPYIELEFVSINSFKKELDEKVVQNFGNFTEEYFYTTDQINIDDNTSTYITKEFFSTRYISYPKNRLYVDKKYDLINDILEKYAPYDKTLDMSINRILKTKFKNYYDHPGHETNDTLFTTKITSKMADLFNIEIELKKLIDIENIWPGRIALFKTKHMRYVQITGKYYINNIFIEFNRIQSQTWQNRTNLKLSRTNYKF